MVCRNQLKLWEAIHLRIASNPSSHALSCSHAYNCNIVKNMLEVTEGATGAIASNMGEVATGM